MSNLAEKKVSSIKPCRKCGSDDIALYQLKNKDYLCRECKKADNRKKYIENRDKYLETANGQYTKTDFLYGTRSWATRMRAKFRYFDRNKERFPICDLSADKILEITSKPCFYCDDSLDRRSVDRIDNSIGHIESNVVPSCYTCNSTRMNNFSHKESKILGKTIAKIKKARRS